ncbi:hypothetical protein QVD99_001156 [Batrachochytrium dendrobatidis]|nr:hypothetical protein QVD99_001156 [Batrachochytrium dendrobatidis]
MDRARPYATMHTLDDGNDSCDSIESNASSASSSNTTSQRRWQPYSTDSQLVQHQGPVEPSYHHAESHSISGLRIVRKRLSRHDNELVHMPLTMRLPSISQQTDLHSHVNDAAGHDDAHSQGNRNSRSNLYSNGFDPNQEYTEPAHYGVNYTRRSHQYNRRPSYGPGASSNQLRPLYSIARPTPERCESMNSKARQDSVKEKQDSRKQTPTINLMDKNSFNDYKHTHHSHERQSNTASDAVLRLHQLTSTVSEAQGWIHGVVQTKDQLFPLVSSGSLHSVSSHSSNSMDTTRQSRMAVSTTVMQHPLAMSHASSSDSAIDTLHRQQAASTGHKRALSITELLSSMNTDCDPAAPRAEPPYQQQSEHPLRRIQHLIDPIIPDSRVLAIPHHPLATAYSDPSLHQHSDPLSHTEPAPLSQSLMWHSHSTVQQIPSIRASIPNLNCAPSSDQIPDSVEFVQVAQKHMMPLYANVPQQLPLLQPHLQQQIALGLSYSHEPSIQSPISRALYFPHQQPSAYIHPYLLQDQQQLYRAHPYLLQDQQHISHPYLIQQDQHLANQLPLSHSTPLYPYASYVYMANGPSFGHFTADISGHPNFGTYTPVVYQQPLPLRSDSYHSNASPLVLPPYGSSAAPLLVGHVQPQANRKEWFEYLLQLAHTKYNAQDYAGALPILQDLCNANQTHLPTLLLLGCTCYSLNLHSLSIYYNKMILQMQPQFAEAYSNLGTTHRALAQNTATKGHAPTHTEIIAGSEVTPVPSDPTTNLNLAEHYYRIAISIRPKYWDASINLAGLLSTQGRWKEAIDVYSTIETLMENEFTPDERFDSITLSAPVAGSSPLSAIPAMDGHFAQTVFEAEQRKRKRIAFLRASGGVVPGEGSGFTVERRRDLYFAKGNLLFATNDFTAAKQEYLKGLVAVGIDIVGIFEGTSSPTIPPPLITPEQVVALIKQKQLHSDATHHPTTSYILQTLAKIYQDSSLANLAVKFYYVSLSIFPAANTCNNLGILLAPRRIQESIQWYEVGLSLNPNHVHLYTNLGSALKDRGNMEQGISCYQRAIALQPDFYIALANLANVFKDLNRVDEAIELYRRALAVKPDFVEAFCNFVNSLLFVCSWESRDQNLEVIKNIVLKQLVDGAATVPRGVPTVLPFHTFTYESLPAWMVREISRRNAERVFWNATTSDWFPGFPDRPRTLGLRSLNKNKTGIITDAVSTASDSKLAAALIRSLQYPYPYSVPPPSDRIHIGYVSSDFTNHPLAHLMQSVFGMHDKSRFRVFCYSLSPSDGSPYRATVERGSDVFLDVSQWTTQQITERIAFVDRIHVLCNLNGYTKGGRNEIFAARPAPIQIALMGFAGTMGAGRVNDPEHPDVVECDVSDDEGYAGDDDSEFDDPVSGNAGVTSTDENDNILFFDHLKTRWIDYMIVDEIAIPQKFVCGEPLRQDEVVPPGKQLIARGPVVKGDDRNRVYTEAMVYMPHSFFVNDHRQGFREHHDSKIDQIIFELDTGIYGLEDSNSAIDLASITLPMATFSQPSSAVPHELDVMALTSSEIQHWRKEQIRRLKMRHELFPWLAEDTVIFANFNQLYKVDPHIFATWMRILSRVPNSILWLLRFPPAGEAHLRRKAVELVGESVSRRLIFTDVAPKHLHIHRGRIADVFLDTPECNAHTTAADILWSGTPIITYPKYDFKMCSRVAASVAYATGSWHSTDRHYIPNVDRSSRNCQGLDIDLHRLRDGNLLGHLMVVNSYEEYEERSVMLAQSLRWGWTRIDMWSGRHQPVEQTKLPKNIGATILPAENTATDTSTPEQQLPNLPVFDTKQVFYPNATRPTHIFVPFGLAIDLRRRLFLTRDSMPLFDTPLWVRHLESGINAMYTKWVKGYTLLQKRNEEEFVEVQQVGNKPRLAKRRSSVGNGASRCLFVKPLEQ